MSDDGGDSLMASVTGGCTASAAPGWFPCCSAAAQAVRSVWGGVECIGRLKMRQFPPSEINKVVNFLHYVGGVFLPDIEEYAGV